MAGRQAAAQGWPAGVGLLRIDEIDSTSAEAFRLAASGMSAPFWVTAVRQTAGRGRSGRQWTSEPGNLYSSYLLRPGAPAGLLHQLAFVAGIAAYETIAAMFAEAAVAADLRLKWPNDLLVDGGKVGGILTEASTQGGRTVVVIGIGINVTHAPEIAGRSTSSLATHGVACSAGAILPALATALDRWLAIWQEEHGFAAIRAAWTAHGPAIGQPLTVGDGDRRVNPTAPGHRRGRYAGLDSDGALLLADEAGAISRVTYGDVTLGWPTSAS